MARNMSARVTLAMPATPSCKKLRRVIPSQYVHDCPEASMRNMAASDSEREGVRTALHRQFPDIVRPATPPPSPLSTIITPSPPISTPHHHHEQHRRDSGQACEDVAGHASILPVARHDHAGAIRTGLRRRVGWQAVCELTPPQSWPSRRTAWTICLPVMPCPLGRSLIPDCPNRIRRIS